MVRSCIQSHHLCLVVLRAGSSPRHMTQSCKAPAIATKSFQTDVTEVLYRGCHRCPLGPWLLQLGSVVPLVSGPGPTSTDRFWLVQTCPCWSRELLGSKLEGVGGVSMVAATEGFSRVFAGCTGSRFFCFYLGYKKKWTMVLSVPFQIKTRISVPTQKALSVRCGYLGGLRFLGSLRSALAK